MANTEKKQHATQRLTAKWINEEDMVILLSVSAYTCIFCL